MKTTAAANNPEDYRIAGIWKKVGSHKFIHLNRVGEHQELIDAFTRKRIVETLKRKAVIAKSVPDDSVPDGQEAIVQ